MLNLKIIALMKQIYLFVCTELKIYVDRQSIEQ